MPSSSTTKRGVDLGQTPLDQRQRKRVLTHRALQSAALAAVLESGLEGATVEDICRRAGVSPRSFYNYFATKEDALVDRPTLSHEAMQAFVHGTGPLIEDLISLVASAADQVMSDLDLIAMRRKLGRRYPQLVGRRFDGMNEFEETIGDLVQQRLRSHSAKTREESQLLGIASAAALRFGWQLWLDRGNPAMPLADDIKSGFRRLRSL